MGENIDMEDVNFYNNKREEEQSQKVDSLSI